MRGDDQELRVLRERLEALEEAVERAGEGDFLGANTIVGITATKTTYPTSVLAYFYLERCTVTGPEEEGEEAVVTPQGNFFYATNIGENIPQPGTELDCDRVGNRWVFNY